MSFSDEELELLYQKLIQPKSSPTKRKVEYQFERRYNESMSRVELLAKALNGIVIEDSGYRGIVYVESKKEYVRYHSVHGVHVVQKTPRVWRVVRSMLDATEIRPFLEEAGLVPKILPTEKPLEQLAKAFGGHVFSTFSTGGGVVKADGIYYRYSSISGLDVVEYIVSKWRSVKHLASRAETLRALMEGSAVNLIKEVARNGGRTGKHGGGADGCGSTAGTGAAEEAEGVPEGVPGEEEGEAGRGSECVGGGEGQA